MFQNFHFVRQLHSKSHIVLRATPSDHKEIHRLLQDVFYKTDPGAMYSKVSENQQISPAIKALSLDALEQDLTFVAKEKEKDKTIIGVSVNGTRPTVLLPNYMDPLLEKVQSKRERTLLELWRFVSLKPANPEEYFKGAKEIFDIRYLVVDPAFRNRGVATALVNISLKEAEAQSHKFARIDCTNHFTTRIASAAGMECAFEIDYKDYQSPSGEYIFQDTIYPHTKLSVYIWRNPS